MDHDMKKLKPCPFCGGEAYVDEFAESMIFATCSKCYATRTAARRWWSNE